MELNEKLDKDYKKDKKVYEKVANFEKDIKQLKEDLKKETRAKEDAQIRKIRAHEDNNKAEEKIADDEIKEFDEKIKEIKEKVEKKQKAISSNKEKVDAYISELNKDPEFEAQMNYILEKKYNRARKKVMKEKEQIDLIIDLCTKHPILENNLKGMIHATEEHAKIKEQWKKIDEDLKKLDPIKDKDKIDQIQNIEIPTLASKEAEIKSKNNTNESAFMAFCQKNNVAIDKDILKRIIEEKRFAHNKETGEIQALKSLKKISKGYDTKIKIFEKSIEKIPNAKVDRELAKSPVQEPTIKEPKTTSQATMPSSGTKEQEENNLPEKKYKFWEFRKRFKAWNEKRKVKKETKLQKKESQNDDKEELKPTNKFKNAYKYDIVKDYIDKRMEDIYKETAKENKAKKEEKTKEDTER